MSKHILKCRLAVLLELLIMCGCVEEFPLDIQNTQANVLVDGLVRTDEDVQFVRVAITKNRGFSAKDTPVTNAIVTITDNDINYTDTLRTDDVITEVNEVWTPDSSLYIGDVTSYYSLVLNKQTNSIDTLWFKNTVAAKKGIYHTVYLKPQIGHTYTLSVKLDEEEYTSTAKINPLPQIDSIAFGSHLYKEGTGEVWHPILYVTDISDDDDYILIANEGFDYLGSLDKYGGADFVWPFFVESDKCMKRGETTSITYPLGCSRMAHKLIVDIEYGKYYKTYVCSIDKIGYDYHKTIGRQIEGDGGLYAPISFEPCSNIIGPRKAFGLFMALQVRVVGRVVGRPWGE